MKVRDLMSHPVHSCSSKDSADRAANLMWEHDVGSIPVIDSETGLLGVVTDRDLAMAAHLQNRHLSEIPVTAILRAQPFTCSPDDTIGRAEQIMAAHQVHRLPVVEDGLVVGILSTNDLVRAASAGWRQYKAAAVVQTLAAVSAPRRGSDAVEDETVVGLDALRQIRDELRLQIHLARADALDEWEKAEAKWFRIQSQLSMSEAGAAKAAKEATVARKQLVREMSDGYARVRESLRSGADDAWARREHHHRARPPGRSRGGGCRPAPARARGVARRGRRAPRRGGGTGPR
jgi:CBS domain-containing protein